MTTLPCGHTFHFNCVVKWFRNQEEASSCALCRKEMPETCDIPILSDDDDDNDDDDDDDDDYDQDDYRRYQNPLITQQRTAMIRTALSLMDDNTLKLFIATKSQAIVRGFLVREVTDRIIYALRAKIMLESSIKRTKMTIAVQSMAIRMGKNAWRRHVATKFQALWRGSHIRKNARRKHVATKFQALWRGFHIRNKHSETQPALAVQGVSIR